MSEKPFKETSIQPFELQKSDGEPRIELETLGSHSHLFEIKGRPDILLREMPFRPISFDPIDLTEAVNITQEEMDEDLKKILAKLAQGKEGPLTLPPKEHQAFHVPSDITALRRIKKIIASFTAHVPIVNSIDFHFLIYKTESEDDPITAAVVDKVYGSTITDIELTAENFGIIDQTISDILMYYERHLNTPATQSFIVDTTLDQFMYGYRMDRNGNTKDQSDKIFLVDIEPHLSKNKADIFKIFSTMFLQIKDIIAKNSSKTQISTPHIYTTVKRIQEQLQKITRDDLSKPPLNINEKDISDTYYYIQAGIDNAAHILISLRDNT